MSAPQKVATLSFVALFAIVAGLALSAFVLSWGLGFSLSWPGDLALWPRAALAGYTNGETVKWIKIAGYSSVLPAAVVALGFTVNRGGADLYGKAKFATLAQIKKMGLRSRTGLLCGFTGSLPSRHYGTPVGKYGQPVDEGGKIKMAGANHLSARNALTYGGAEHMVAYAPTRSGKTAALVIPNLVNWPESAVILDIKKELWGKTAGFRAANGQEVYLFDPLEKESRTHRWNPLGNVRVGTEMQIDDLQRLAALFIPVSDKDPFFDLSARNAFVAIGGYLAETPELPLTLGEIYRQLTSHTDFVETFRHTIASRKESSRPLSPQVFNALNDFMAKSENTFESIKGSITSHLGLYANPLIDRATSASDFDFADLRKRKMSIYVAIAPSNISRLSPLFNLFFQSCVDANMQELPEHNPELKHRVLLCMDEFAAAGKMQSFQDGIAYFAGYGLKVLTVLQSPAQLSMIYGKDAADVYMTNAGVEVIFTPKLQQDAKNISETLGTRSEASQSETKQKALSAKGGNSINTSQSRRDLMLPQELRTMSDQEEIVLIAGHPPVKAKKIRYYAEESILSRTRTAPPVVPSLLQNDSAADIAQMKRENEKLVRDMEIIKATLAKVSALAQFQEENVSNGQAAEVEMTEAEIEDPSKITMERLSLLKSSSKDKIADLRKKGELTSDKGQRELLATFGIQTEPRDR